MDKKTTILGRLGIAFKRFLPNAVTSQFESVRYSKSRAQVYTHAPSDFKVEMSSFDRSEMVRKSRWLEKNCGFFREQITSKATYAVGDGITAQCMTDDEEWNDLAEIWFKQWCRKPDITGRFNMVEIQHMVCRAIDRDGEIFIVKTRNKAGIPKLQIVESHRVHGTSSPMTSPKDKEHDGVIFGSYGQPLAYVMWRSDESPRKVPANAVLHVFEAEHPSGARNHPPLQHSINHMIDEMEILALEKRAVKDGTDITRVIKRHAGEFAGQDLDAFGDENGTYYKPYTDPTDLQFREIGGKVIALQPGEDFQSYQSNRPNSTFTGFLEHIRRDSAAGGLPYEFIHDAGGLGGPAVRLVLARAERNFSHRQQVLINRFLTPIWGYVIGNAIKNGDLPDNPKWQCVNWHTPKKVSIDAGREAQQNRDDIELGLKSASEDYAERGLDFKEQLIRRANDFRLIQEVAAEYDVPEGWLWRPTRANPEDVAEAEAEADAEDVDENGEPIDKDTNEQEDKTTVQKEQGKPSKQPAPKKEKPKQK